MIIFSILSFGSGEGRGFESRLALCVKNTRTLHKKKLLTNSGAGAIIAVASDDGEVSKWS